MRRRPYLPQPARADLRRRPGHRLSACTGTALPPASAKSGYIWFFDPENVELVVKALDGRPINGKFWFFHGALSNVE
jgi:hypothetical protein